MKKVLTSCLVVLLLMFGASVVRAQEGEQVHYRGIITIVNRNSENFVPAKAGEPFMDAIHVYNIPYSEEYELTFDIEDEDAEKLQYKGIDHYENISEDEFVIYTKLVITEKKDNFGSYLYKYVLDVNGEKYETETFATVVDSSDNYIYISGRNTLVGGNSEQYKAYFVSVDNNGPVEITNDVTWSVRAENGISVNESGLVSTNEADNETTFLVSCTYNPDGQNNLSASYNVKVYANEESLRDEIILGGTNDGQIKSRELTIDNLWNSTYDVYGYGPFIEDATFTLTSSDDSVVMAYPNKSQRPGTASNQQGNDQPIDIVVKSTGKARITVKAEYEGKEYETYIDYIVTDDISGKIHISVDGEEIVKVDEEITLKADVKYDDGDIDISKITWKSENPDIASVDNSGVVKGLKAGVATITVCVPYPEDDTRFISYSYDVTVEASEENKQVINGDGTTADTVIPQTGDIKALFIIPIGIIATYGIIKLRKYKNSLF